MTQRSILQFSGGKDSTALLYFMRPYLANIEVCFVDTGGAMPEVTDFIAATCERLKIQLTTIRPPVDVVSYTAAEGLPTDLVPAWSDRQYAWLNRVPPEQQFQSPMACCGAMLWQPMQDHIAATGCKLVLRGAKECDAHRGVPPGFVDQNGVMYSAPIWEWSNQKVFDYLRAVGVTLPKHYQEFTDSADCWCCTAYLSTEYGAKKLAYMKREHPEIWPELRQRIITVRAAAAVASNAILTATQGAL